MYINLTPIIVLVAGYILFGITSCNHAIPSRTDRVQQKCESKWYYNEPKDSHCYDLQQQLTSAVVRGDVPLVSESLDRGANVNGGFDQSIPVLEVAAAFGRTEVVEMLIEAGADINLVRPLGQTALKAAVTRRHVDTARILIEKGANVCEKTEKSSLQYAVESDDSQMINMLVNAGAKECS